MHLPLECGSRRLVLKGSALWRSIDGAQRSFTPSARREDEVKVNAELVRVTRWTFAYTTVDQMRWIRQLYAMDVPEGGCIATPVLVTQRVVWPKKRDGIYLFLRTYLVQ